ncbi:hypothetical protein [Pseudomonas prosekii]|uniref:hypothetical protein n=1 Tax=Pseudomonas prosekii TaxID=1148509 RepID=UPI00387AB96D
MVNVNAATPTPEHDGVQQWRTMWRDQQALLDHPGAHHKALLTWAYALHREAVIDSDLLSDLLELADGALAYAVDIIHHTDNDQ